jgi:hypothetical protein
MAFWGGFCRFSLRLKGRGISEHPYVIQRPLPRCGVLNMATRTTPMLVPACMVFPLRFFQLCLCQRCAYVVVYGSVLVVTRSFLL